MVYNISKEISYQQAVLAFADDTTWIARSKTELQTIVNTAHEFYKINNIEINSKKSELLVFNPDKKTKAMKSTSRSIWARMEMLYMQKVTITLVDT